MRAETASDDLAVEVEVTVQLRADLDLDWPLALGVNEKFEGLC